MYMTQRKDTGDLAEAEKEKIVGNLRKKVYIWGVDDLNLYNPSSTDIKRGEYLVNLMSWQDHNGITIYRSETSYWDTELGQWMALERDVNSSGGESISLGTGGLYDSNSYDDCKTEYLGQCSGAE